MDLEFRLAKREDLERIVELLADDVLGSKRERYENPLPECYIDAFNAIDSDRNNELVVACMNDDVVGVVQITFTPHIARQGGWRATIEGVRTSSSARGEGIGTKLIQYAIQRAKDRACQLVQLTSDKQREDAIRFYEALGFQATHEGLKMSLTSGPSFHS
jgi:ribosomal protein S18 acetylase RimI-like enzyme